MRSAATRRSRAPRSHAASASRSRPCRSRCRRCSTRGWCARPSPSGDGPSYGAVFFEPVPDAAYVLGLDVGARFVRGALCDLTGDVRARQDVELPERTAAAAMDAITSLVGDARRGCGVARGAGRRRRGRRAGRGRRRQHRARRERHRARGRRLRARARASGSAAPVTIENDINLSALGEQWRGDRARCRRLRLHVDRHRSRRGARAARRAAPRAERRSRRARLRAGRPDRGHRPVRRRAGRARRATGARTARRRSRRRTTRG